MAQFITEEVLKTIKDMLCELLDKEQEGIDDLFGDQEGDNNRKVTATLRVNMAAKSATSIEVKAGIDYVLEPSVPAKHKKEKLTKLIDTAQGVIEFPESKSDDIDEE